MTHAQKARAWDAVLGVVVGVLITTTLGAFTIGNRLERLEVQVAAMQTVIDANFTTVPKARTVSLLTYPDTTPGHHATR